MEDNPARSRGRTTVAGLFDALLRPAAVVLCIVGLIWVGGSYTNHRIDEKEAAKQAALDHSHPVWEVDMTIEIASLKSATTEKVSGGAFLMSSKTDERLRYVEKRSDGGYSLESISADNAVIYEIDDGSKPRIELQSCHLEADKAEHQSWFNEHGDSCDAQGEWTPKATFVPDDSDQGEPSIFRETRTRIYVPEKTIVDEFDINAGD